MTAFWGRADIGLTRFNVRFLTESGHERPPSECLRNAFMSRFRRNQNSGKSRCGRNREAAGFQRLMIGSVAEGLVRISTKPGAVVVTGMVFCLRAFRS